MGLPPTPPAPILPWIALSFSTTQSVNSGATGALLQDTLRGNYAWPAPTLSTADFTFPVPGVVIVSAYDVDFGDDGITFGTGIRAVGRRLNGDVNTTRYGVLEPAAGGAVGTKSILSTTFSIRVAAGDVVRIIVTHTAGSALSLGLLNLRINYTFVGNSGSPSDGALGTGN